MTNGECFHNSAALDYIEDAVIEHALAPNICSYIVDYKETLTLF